MKQCQELEYVLYPLKIKIDATRRWNATRRWANKINMINTWKHRGINKKADGIYIFKYVLEDAYEKEMVKNSACFNITFTIRNLSLNPYGNRVGCMYMKESMSQNLIYNLRAAIYETKDATQELKKDKAKMIQALAKVQRKLLVDYFDDVPGNKEILAEWFS